jgi:IclR family pca regulon transcriptional regulator
MTERREETVASFRHGIDVIRSFTRDCRRQTITEVGARTGLSRSTARRLLLTLCETGLARTDGKHFQLTPAVLAFGQAFLAGMSELEIVRDQLLEFTHQTRESASAAMLVGAEVIYVIRLPSPNRNLPMALGPGMRRPAHATAIGHVLLANLHLRELDRFLDTAALEPYTEHTITDRRQLRSRLDEVRSRGFATIIEGLTPGLSSIAVAVPATTADARLGPGTRLGIASGVQTSRFNEEAMKVELLPMLRRTATDIAHLTANT